MQVFHFRWWQRFVPSYHYICWNSLCFPNFCSLEWQIIRQILIGTSKRQHQLLQIVWDNQILAGSHHFHIGSSLIVITFESTYLSNTDEKKHINFLICQSILSTIQKLILEMLLGVLNSCIENYSFYNHIVKLHFGFGVVFLESR